MAKPGYLYVLGHPSDPGLYKIGMTTRHPDARLVEHNTNVAAYTGRLVKETGQKWELKTSIEVADTVLAEAAFWGATPLADIPFRGGIEVERMEWKWVEAGLKAAKLAKPRLAKPVPDWVYAYTAWMIKRLSGRGIELVGQTTSRSGKSKFRCSNGHEWKTRSTPVSEGEGCPECGMGETTFEEIWESAKLGYLNLLTHPEQPGLVKFVITYGNASDEEILGDWEVHRHRFVEDPVLAEKLIWELLGQPKPEDSQAVQCKLEAAEQAIRDLVYRMFSEAAKTAKDRL
jgi:T5orf172 domain